MNGKHVIMIQRVLLLFAVSIFKGMNGKHVIMIQRVLLLFAVSIFKGACVSVVTNNKNGTFQLEHSPNQLDKWTYFPVLIIPGSELDHNTNTNISDRYNCGRYVFSFQIVPPSNVNVMRSVKLSIFLAENLTTADNPTCLISWGDGEPQQRINVASNGTERVHDYVDYGIYRVWGNCSDDLLPDNDTECPIRNISCVRTYSFFDYSLKSVRTPLKYDVTKPMKIDSLLRLNRECAEPVVITWRLTHILNETETHDINIIQPNSSVLTIGAQTLDPGEYIVFLEVSHPGEGTDTWMDDFLFMYIALPELVPIISGGHLRTVEYGGVININASESFDQVTSVNSVGDIPLITKWSFAYFPSGLPSSDLYLFEKWFPEYLVLPEPLSSTASSVTTTSSTSSVPTSPITTTSSAPPITTTTSAPPITTTTSAPLITTTTSAPPITTTTSAPPITTTSSAPPITTTTSAPPITTTATASPITTTAPPSPITTNGPAPTGTPGVEREFYVVEQDNGTILEIDTTMFHLYQYAFVMFSMIRGNRRSSTVQIIQFIQNPIPVKLSCVYNCNKGRERKFNYDRLEFDALVPTDLAPTLLNYSWNLYQWSDSDLTWVPISIYTPTGTQSRSIRIPYYSVRQGLTYRVTLDVHLVEGNSTQQLLPGSARIEMFGTVNILPYKGNCTTDIMAGKAARTWFMFRCMNWRGVDQRRTNSSMDYNPYLTYTAVQYTVGAVVQEEPILMTRARDSYLILKLGDPNNSYKTTIKVRATDIYNNYMEFDIEVQARPAFDIEGINGTEEGKYIITNYSSIDYIADEKELATMGKVDLIVLLVSSVCSHIHQINLTQWEPPVPRKLGKGKILDLQGGGNNTDTGGYDNVVEQSATVLYDPATLALMEVMQNLTNVIRTYVDNYFENGTEGVDKFLTSTIINAFTNLAAKPEYADDETKVEMIYLSDKVGSESMQFNNQTTVDDSAEKEKIAGEVYNMSMALVNNVVPDDLRQFFYVEDLQSSVNQIDDMLTIAGKSVNIYNASLSPMERAQVYLTMQYLLQTDIEARKKNAQETAKMSLKLFRMVQDILNLCLTCSNENHEYTEQLVANNELSVVENTSYITKTSEFQVTGLADLIEQDGDSTTHTPGSSTNRSNIVSLSAVEYSENVFMYDDDQRSSSVTSNVLHIDVKVSDNRVYPKSIVIYQSVTPPNVTTYQPVVNMDDVSDFSLHSFVYKYSTDYICLIIKPENENTVTFYTLFFRFRYSPTIFEYDFILNVSGESNWKRCIPPEDMHGYTGLVYIGVQVPDAVQHISYNYTQVTLGCVTWEEGINRWRTDKCHFKWYEDNNTISCNCTGLTELTLGNTFSVAPNTIDFSTVFLKFSPLSQAAVMGAMSGILIIYIVTLFIVIPMDRKDVVKWGITPLKDNAFGDGCFYILKVFTGMRKDAGTTSRVAFILSGDKTDTGPRQLADELSHDFTTGSVRCFFLATGKHLGCLLHLSIWHDNTGSGNMDSWYLSRVEVYDVEKRKTYAFIAERWISADIGLDIQIRGTIPEEELQLDSRFFHQARQKLSDNHMWISIAYRPQASCFTRAQRATCALAYISLAMIANAMYFNPDDNYESPAAFKAGPFRFSLEQIAISLICAMITTPPVMLMMFLFKYSKPKVNTKSGSTSVTRSGCCWSRSRERSGECMSRSDGDARNNRSTTDNRQSTSLSVSTERADTCLSISDEGSKSYHSRSDERSTIRALLADKLQCCLRCFKKSARSEEVDDDLTREDLMLSRGIPEFQSGFSLPHRCVYIAWFLSVTATLVSAFFVLLYSMEWGKQKSEEWLTSFLLSIFESMMFLDPILVILVSFLFACLIRVPETNLDVDIDEVVMNYKRKQGLQKGSLPITSHN